MDLIKNLKKQIDLIEFYQIKEKEREIKSNALKEKINRLEKKYFASVGICDTLSSISSEFSVYETTLEEESAENEKTMKLLVEKIAKITRGIEEKSLNVNEQTEKISKEEINNIIDKHNKMVKCMENMLLELKSHDEKLSRIKRKIREIYAIKKKEEEELEGVKKENLNFIEKINFSKKKKKRLEIKLTKISSEIECVEEKISKTKKNIESIDNHILVISNERDQLLEEMRKTENSVNLAILKQKKTVTDNEKMAKKCAFYEKLLEEKKWLFKESIEKQTSFINDKAILENLLENLKKENRSTENNNEIMRGDKKQKWTTINEIEQNVKRKNLENKKMEEMIEEKMKIISQSNEELAEKETMCRNFKQKQEALESEESMVVQKENLLKNRRKKLSDAKNELAKEIAINKHLEESLTRYS